MYFAVTELKRLRGDELESLWVRTRLRDNCAPSALPYCKCYNLYSTPAVIISNDTARSAHVFKSFQTVIIVTLSLYTQVHLVKVD